MGNAVATILFGLWFGPAAAVFGVTLVWWWRAGRRPPLDDWTTVQWLTLPAAFWWLFPLVLAYDRITGRNPADAAPVPPKTAPKDAQDRTRPADVDDDTQAPHWAS